MGRVKQGRVNSRRARTRDRAFGAAVAPAPRYDRGTRFYDGKDRRVARAERAEKHRTWKKTMSDVLSGRRDAPVVTEARVGAPKDDGDG